MTFAATIYGVGAACDASAVDKLVLSTVNAPYKHNISSATLQECISQAKLNDWQVHVATFFTDVSTNLIFSFASSHGISKSKLAEAYMVVKTDTGEWNPDLEAELVPMAAVA